MSVDLFSQISAERFERLEESQQGRRGLLFPYFNHRADMPSPLLGLWLSEELVKRGLESAHYIPDNECSRALRASGAYCTGVSVWLGLAVELSPVEEGPRSRISIPSFMVEDYKNLVVNSELSVTQELEQRFGVSINVTS